MNKVSLAFIFLLCFITTAISQNYAPNELLIQLHQNSSQRLVSEKMSQVANADLEFFQLISSPLNIYHLKYNDQVDLNKIIKNSFDIKEIAVIQKNHFVEDRATIPNDTLFGDQWHLNNTGQGNGNADADIDASEAWDVTTGGTTSHGDTIVVCIIENQGVQLNHPDLAPNMWKNYAEIPGNGIDDDNNGYVDDFEGWNVLNNSGVMTAGSHGTSVAGMIGAVGNNITGISGVNHQVKMMVVQGQSSATEATIISAYTYPLVMRQKYNSSNGSEGAFVVVTNSSWGINRRQAGNHPIWCSFYDSLGTHGILNISSATNLNDNVDIVGDMPTTCTSDFLIAVTNTNSADFRNNSGYGTTHVDLGAPGTDIALTNNGGGFNSVTGTSFAAPCVAGSVALLYAAPCADFISFAKSFPDSAARRMRAFLLDNVDNISSLTGQVNTGGRLNVNNSMQAIIGGCDTNSCISPFNLSANALNDTSATISWQSINSSGFIVELALAPASPPVRTINYTTGNINTHSFLDLTPCTEYFATITGLCGTDTSNTSYTIAFTTDGCCTNPPLINDSSSITQLGISWQPVLYATNYILRYQEVGSGLWLTDTVLTNSKLYTNLDTCTSYHFQIKTICADSTRGFSESYTFQTKGCGSCFEGSYCEIIPSNVSTQFEWIESVTLNSTTITSGNNFGYYDGGIFGNGLLPGAQYTIAITPGFADNPFSQRYRVWIDMDQNGTFETTELLLSSIPLSTPFTGILFIPETNIYGVTKMRIASNGQRQPSVCADESLDIFGEYEDYCIYVGNTASISEFSTIQPTIFPNPTTNSVTVDLQRQITNVTITDLSGKLQLQSFSPPANRLSLENMAKGLYIIRFEVDGQIFQQKIVKQ